MKAAPTAFLFLSFALILRATPELAGEMTTPDGQRLVLADNTSGKTSDWLRVGDSFEGYVVESYDLKTDVFTLRQGTDALQLSLRGSRVVDRAPRGSLTREKVIEFASWRFAQAKVVFRGLSVYKGGWAYFKCLEVWKAGEGGPGVGEVIRQRIPGAAVSAAAAAPPMAGAEVDFSHAPEQIIFLGAYPVEPKTSTGGYMLTKGKLALYPELPVDELRDLLTQPAK